MKTTQWIKSKLDEVVADTELLNAQIADRGIEYEDLKNHLHILRNGNESPLTLDQTLTKLVAERNLLCIILNKKL